MYMRSKMIGIQRQHLAELISAGASPRPRSKSHQIVAVVLRR
jgi:hypothetical protein